MGKKLELAINRDIRGCKLIGERLPCFRIGFFRSNRLVRARPMLALPGRKPGIEAIDHGAAQPPAIGRFQLK